MLSRFRLLYLASLLLNAAWIPCQSQLPEYQQNSPAASETTDSYSVSDGTKPIVETVTINTPVNLILKTIHTEGVIMSSAGFTVPISRSQGAYVTPNGQLFNLPLNDPSLSTVDISDLIGPSGVLTLPLNSAVPVVMSFQMVVSDPTHPDGFSVSAPVVVRYIYPTGDQFDAALDPSVLASNVISVKKVWEPELDQDPSLGGTLDFGQSQVEGCMTLSIPGLEPVTQDVTIDVATNAMLVDGGAVSTLGDIFPEVYSPDTDGELSLCFDTAVTIDISGLVLEGPCLLVTDKGCEVPVSDDLFPNKPDITPAQSAVFIAKGKGKLTSTAPPTDSYNCHGWVFGCGNTNIFGESVDCILDDNGYKPEPNPKVGDVVIYRDAAGKIWHSGKVTAVNGAGVVTEVEGKWGCYDRVTHPPGFVYKHWGPPSYYSTPRADDCLIWRC